MLRPGRRGDLPADPLERVLNVGELVVGGLPGVALHGTRQSAVGRKVLDEDPQLPQGDLPPPEVLQVVPAVDVDQRRFDGLRVTCEEVPDRVGVPSAIASALRLFTSLRMNMTANGFPPSLMNRSYCSSPRR